MSEAQSILVVEDSKTQALHARMLLQQGGYRVEIAADGAEGIVAARKQPFDLVLTDLQMPEINGLELVQILRSEQPRLPVIVTTDKGSEETAVEALEKGAASYIPKRLLANDLLETIARTLALYDAQRRQFEVSSYLESTRLEFSLANDETLIPHVISRLQKPVEEVGICDADAFLHIATALDEALINAMIHGNLEVSSELRELDHARPYYQTIRDRKQQEPFSGRRVHLILEADREQAVFIIRDEGPGFDVASLPDLDDPENLERISGRGMLLINAFMDEVSHNEEGNQITLIKRKDEACDCDDDAD